MTEKIKAFCCTSGGKESILSLYKARESGIDISYLINMVSSDGKYSRTHGLSLNLLELQADAIGIPIIQTRTSWQTYENEFKKTILSLKKENINAGVFGDIDLQGHRDWVERVCREVEIKPVLPLWKMKREEILLEFINSDFKAVVCAVKAGILGKEWLGREINEEFIKDLKNLDVDICGENGEYHTFVYGGPIFKKPVNFTTGGRVLRDRDWFLELIL